MKKTLSCKSLTEAIDAIRTIVMDKKETLAIKPTKVLVKRPYYMGAKEIYRDTYDQ